MPAGSVSCGSLHHSIGDIGIAKPQCAGRKAEQCTLLEPNCVVTQRWQPLHPGRAYKASAICQRKRAGYFTCKATRKDAQRDNESKRGSATPKVSEKPTDDKMQPVESATESQSTSERRDIGRVEESGNSWVKIVAGAAALVFLGSIALGSFLPPDTGLGNGQNESAQVQASGEEAKQLRKQAAAFEALVQQRPSDVESLEGAGVIYATLGDYGKAAEYLEKLVKVRPNYVEALRLLAEVKFEAKDFSRAAYMYRRAIKASPEESLDLLKGLADTLVSDKRPNEAVEELLKARERIRKAGKSLTVESSEQETEQRQAAVEGAESSTDEIPVDLLLAQAYQFSDKPEDAQSVYDELITTHPDDFRAYLAKGILLKQTKRESEAEQNLEKAKELAPEAAKQLIDGLIGQPR